jgi:hypothetical protein
VKNLENNIRPVYDTVIENINALLSFREIVSEYSADPDATMAKLIKIDKSEAGEIFIDIAKGLKGELIRDKSIILGRNVITQYMRNLVETCLKNIEELYKQPIANLNIVKINDNTLSESSNMEVLEDYMNIIKSELIRLEYVGRKAEKIISPYLAGTVGIQKDVGTYLSVGADIIKNMSFDSNIPAAIVDHNIHKKTSMVVKGFIKDMISKNTVVESDIEGMISQLDEHKVDLVDVKHHHAYVLDIVNASKSVVMQSQLYDLFTDMHDALVIKFPEMEKDTKVLDNNISKIENSNMLSELLNEYVGIIEGYHKNEMTLDVMMAATKVCGIMIGDSTNALVKLLNLANTEITTVNNNINLINQLYDIDNEVITSATLSGN